MYEVAMFMLGSILVVPIQVELHDSAAQQLQEDILDKIEKTGASGLVLDVSAISIVDSFLGRLLGEVAKTVHLMGAETLLVGLKKEVVITLIELGMNLHNLRTARSIEEGLALLEALQQPADQETEGYGDEP